MGYFFHFSSLYPTLLLNEGILRAYRGKKLRLKNILKFPSKSEDQKLFIKEEKLLFFITNLRAFCIHFLQILPSEFEGNTLRFRGKKQYIFQTKFFPSVCPRYALGMPSFNNSVFFSDCILWKYFFCAALDMITTLPLCLTFTQINKTRCKLVISCFERLCYYLLFQTDFHFKVNKNLCACYTCIVKELCKISLLKKQTSIT